MKFGTRTEKFEPIPIELKSQAKAKVQTKPFSPFQKFNIEQEKIIVEKAQEHILKNRQESIIKNFRDARIHKKNLKDKDEAEKASWQKSMIKKQEMEAAQKEYHDVQANHYQNVLLNAIKESENAAQAKIEIFNNNLSRLGLDVDAGDSSKLKKNNNIISAELAMQKMREKVQAKENARKEKERRQRKLKVDQRKAMSELDQKKSENDLLNEQKNNVSNINKITSSNYELKYNFSSKQNYQDQINSGHDGLGNLANMGDGLDKESEEIKSRMFLHEIARHGLKKTQRELELKKQRNEISKGICNQILDLMVDLSEVILFLSLGMFQCSKNNWKGSY